MRNRISNNVFIKKAKKEDVPKLLRLRALARQTAHTSSTTLKKDQVESYKKIISKYERYLKTRGNYLYTAQTQNIILGYIRVRRDLNGIRVMSLYVKNKYQQMGIGSMLLKWVLDMFPQDCVSLAVVKTNTRAINFYLKHGFKIEKKKALPIMFNGKSLERIEMSYFKS